MDEDKMKPKDLTQRLQPKMTILNYKDNHFNQVVDKNSMLAVSGSLSFQRELAEKAQAKTEGKKSDSVENTPNELVLKKKINELEIALQKVLYENEKLRFQKPVDSENKNNQNKQEVYECDGCGKMYKHKSNLDIHIRKDHYWLEFDQKDCNCAYPCITKVATVEAPIKSQTIIHNTLQHKQQE